MRSRNQLPLELLLLVPALLGQPVLSVPRFGPDTAHANGIDAPRSATGKKLHGRFLHITDFHPDPFYKTYSATDADSACHRGTGSAGYYGAETSSCDSPVALVDATFDWIDKNIKDEVDFVIWTGDSARHDNDEKLPRNTQSVVEQNQLLVTKFLEVFGKKHHDHGDDYPRNALEIPVVPNIGNNDILPHNIFAEGPNFWTNKYLDVWRSFIPEEQRHQFQRGGWFYVEAIPNKLAVFSLNTMYFFASNSAVDGCAAKSEPGYEQFEWLRIQLQFMRERGMKAILIGHVPPARTDNKMSWDETCWQKYALWMRQYRDVILTTLYGHMNIAHFMLQDFSDIRPDVLDGRMDPVAAQREFLGDEIRIESATDYLLDLRDEWSRLPTSPTAKSRALEEDDMEGSLSWLWSKMSTSLGAKRNKKKHSSHRNDREAAYLDKIGGKWGERYSVTHVQASVVPNYFPTMRIFEYNTTGLKHADSFTGKLPGLQQFLSSDNHPDDVGYEEGDEIDEADYDASDAQAQKKKRKYRFKVPHSPSKHTPPGPAYSPQSLSLLGYTQFYANLTHINNDFTTPSDNEDDPQVQSEDDAGDNVDGQRWKPGKHHGKHPHKHKDQKPHPNEFKYEVEYSTFEDNEFGLKDLTVRSYLKLAGKIGSHKPTSTYDVADQDEDDVEIADFKRQPKRETTVLYLRHCLQKGMLNGNSPKSADMEVMDGYLTQLEQHKNLEAEIIKTTKIDKVLMGITKLSPVPPKDVEYHFVKRSATLLDIWTKSLERASEMQDEDTTEDESIDGDVDAEKKHKKKKKHHKRKHKTKQWLAFVRRAFVETVDPASIDSMATSTEEQPQQEL